MIATRPIMDMTQPPRRREAETERVLHRCPGREDHVKSEFLTSPQEWAASAGVGSVDARRPPGHVALLGNFLPRRCGIAVFTSDVHAALVQRFPDIAVDVYAMDDRPGAYSYPDEVTARIAQDDADAYGLAAQAINASGAELLWIQHEYGIFGGSSGAHLLRLIDALDIPFVVTLHTILAAPSPDQRRVMLALVQRAARLFAMAERGRDLLVDVYGADPRQVQVVPHGVPDRPWAPAAPFKERLGLAGRNVLLTFGLLSPGKGIETLIEALPAIVARHPETLYVVLGATHPHLIAREGEAYRQRLRALAEGLGVDAHIRWIDAFVETDRLLDFIAAADIYVTPYGGAAQVTSGTLAYAVAMGKPVVSTRYVHAVELLKGGHGTLVDFGDSQAFARAINALLDDPAERQRIARANYALGRTMVWPRVAETTMRAMADILAPGPARPAPASNLPPRASFAAVTRLSDDTGIVQHSVHGVPDRRHGYCVDDNARALILMHRANALSDAVYDRWTPVYAAFVQHAWNPDRQRFRNFMGFDRQWREDIGSEDSGGRALWSLGVTARDGRRDDVRRWAAALFDEAAPHIGRPASPRARAFAILAAAAMRDADPGHDPAAAMIDACAAGLMDDLARARRADWLWLEPYLAYDNARLPEALLRAGAARRRPDWIDAGLACLRWLTAQQTSEGGDFRPVGTAGFGQAYAAPLPFAQQPVEAWATIEACDVAFAATADRWWLEEARRAYRWYEGGNELGLVLADPATGECFDGLEAHGANRNRGAESVLAFQLANVAIRTWSTVDPPRRKPTLTGAADRP